MALTEQAIQVLPLSKVKPPKFRVREDVGLLDDLKASMQAKGLLQPIIVRPMNGHFEVVAGHRRYVCALELGWKEIPATVVTAGDKEAFEMSLVENIQRKSMDPIEEANAFKRYCVDNGWGSQRELAHRLGISDAQISQRLQLLKLGEENLYSVKTGKVSVSHAEAIASLDTEKATEVMDKVVDYGLDVSKTRTVVQAVKQGMEPEQAVHHVLSFPDVPLIVKPKVDFKVSVREHLVLCVRQAIKSMQFYLEELPVGDEKHQWTTEVLAPMREIENTALKFEKQFNKGNEK